MTSIIFEGLLLKPVELKSIETKVSLESDGLEDSMKIEEGSNMKRSGKCDRFFGLSWLKNPVFGLMMASGYKCQQVQLTDLIFLCSKTLYT